MNSGAIGIFTHSGLNPSIPLDFYSKLRLLDMNSLANLSMAPGFLGSSVDVSLEMSYYS